MFLSMVWSIFNIGDVRQLGTIGKKLMSRFMLISSAFGVACAVAAVLWLRLDLGRAQSGEEVLQSVVEMVLDIIPANIVDPFRTGNTLQILLVGAVVGISMIFLRDRMRL